MIKFSYKYKCNDEEKEYLTEMMPTPPVFELKHKIDDNEVAWPDVLADFVEFMGKCYGYDISKQVAIARPKPYSNTKWTGPVFDPNEEL